MYAIALVSCIIFWPIAVLFIKYYHDCKYYRARGEKKAHLEKSHEDTEVLWSITRVMEVSLESSFQPLVQLYIVFPKLIFDFSQSTDHGQELLTIFTTIISKCEGRGGIQMAQNMSIITSILGMNSA